MRLFNPGVATPINGGQIQKAFHRIVIRLEGAKAAGVDANQQFLADLASVFFQLRRVGGKLGEKIIWPRISGKELLAVANCNYGHAITTGALADTSYKGRLSVELNKNAAHSLDDGAYLEFQLENGVAGLAVIVDGIGHQNANMGYVAIERQALQASESRKVMVNDPAGKFGAFRVLLENTISAARFNSAAPFTADSTDVEGQLLEESALVHNLQDCGTEQVHMGAFPVDEDTKSVDVDNQNTPGAVIVLREYFL